MCENQYSLLKRVDHGVLKWFGHVKRIREDRIIKRIYRFKEGTRLRIYKFKEGARLRGRPMDGFKEAVTQTSAIKYKE